MLERLLFTANSSPLTTLSLCLQLDLLPKGTQEPAVLEWLLRTAEYRRVHPISAHLVSSRTGANVSAAASAILVERKGRDIYILGAANVGKSAFVRALVRDMSSWQVSGCSASSAQWCPDGAVIVARCAAVGAQVGLSCAQQLCFCPGSDAHMLRPLQSGNFDAAAALQSRRLPVESAMPGTTLGLIQLKSFESGGCLYGEQCPAYTIGLAHLSGDCDGFAPGNIADDTSCSGRCKMQRSFVLFFEYN